VGVETRFQSSGGIRDLRACSVAPKCLPRFVAPRGTASLHKLFYAGALFAFFSA
jgi:hypothetical protein